MRFQGKHVCRNGTVIEIGNAFTRIILNSGRVVTGAPQQNEEQRATARELGYGEDTALMVEEHDPMHALLCDWLGLESLTLKDVAGELPAERKALVWLEEDAVLAVTKFMRAAGGRLPVE